MLINLFVINELDINLTKYYIVYVYVYLLLSIFQ